MPPLSVASHSAQHAPGYDASDAIPHEGVDSTAELDRNDSQGISSGAREAASASVHASENRLNGGVGAIEHIDKALMESQRKVAGM